MKAAMLFSRMTREGYIPSISLRVQMHLAKLAELSVREDMLLEPTVEAFSHDSFDETALRDVLRMLVEGLGTSSHFVREIVEQFLQTRPAEYKLSSETISYLVKTSHKEGDKEGAEYWSAYSTSDSAAPGQPRPSSNPAASAPYTTLLRELAASKPTFEIYKWTLERMRADNVQPDLSFFNALLAYESGRHNYEVVFAIYRKLMEKRSATVKPSVHTFATVFRALHRLSCSHRYRRANRIRVPPNMPSARSVYRDLLTCHLEYTEGKSNKPSPALDQTALHKALRTFMAQCDYAAAYAAVRAFRLFPQAVGQPTIVTYRLVFGGILGRIKVEFPRIVARMISRLDAESIWAYRFLGMQNLPSHLRYSIDNDLSMVHRVLLVGTDPRLSFEFISAPKYRRGQPQPEELTGLLDDIMEAEVERVQRISDSKEFHPHGMPTPVELTGLKPAPDGQTYSLVPLERVLRRAIVASVPQTGAPLARQMSEAISQAKDEMVVRWSGGMPVGRDISSSTVHS
ncbi:hypothetical protein OH77DRAFT_794799 [Trametes cingulata]|nr:hypothetical protein OH77DRAFT_794799 [Trametes cingulata]